MAENINIVNRSLSLIGANQITGSDLLTTTDTSEEAIQAGLHYQDAKEYLLSAAYWHFAKRKIILTAEATTPPVTNSTEWKYYYDLPSEFVTLYKFEPRIFDYTMYNDATLGWVLYTNYAGPLEMDYIHDIDESQWPRWFRHLFQFYFASILALPITRKAEISREMKNQFIENIGVVSNVNATQVPTESFGNSPFVDIR